MTTATKEEALSLLRHTRRDLIERARDIGRRIARSEGTVHARRIYAEMQDEIKAFGVNAYFLGAVFSTGDFEWTGEWYQVQKDDGKCHGGAGIKVWRLRG